MLVTEADPNLVNTVIITYGKGKIPETVTKVSTKGKVTTSTKMVTVDLNNTATITNEDLAVSSGAIVWKADKPNMNTMQANAYANKMLRKLERDGNFELDCTVIGSTQWLIGQWTTFYHESMGIDDTYLVTKTDFKIDENKAPVVDLTLMDYLPSYTSDYSPTDGSGSVDMSTVDSIGEAEAQFGDVQIHGYPADWDGVDDASVIEKYGFGDCWADSSWLYNQLTAANIPCQVMQCPGNDGTPHRWVQVNLGNGFVDWDYTKYNSQHYGSSPCIGGSYVQTASKV
jgi:hypothetical protein